MKIYHVSLLVETYQRPGQCRPGEYDENFV